MGDPLIAEVLDRLGRARIDETANNFVVGALLGRLDDVIEGCEVEPSKTVDEAAKAPPRAFLKSISVTSFRGIGALCELPLNPGPGLTLVVGRNGSGKSSIAEAAEYALTGDSLRWSGRSVDWKKGWRNLHAGDDPEILVRFQVDGEREPRSVRVSWRTSELESNRTVVTVPGRKGESLDSLGWSEAAKTFRPFLSYKELATMVEGRPIDRYNALAPMLGMESLQAPIENLRQARLASEKQLRAGEEHVAQVVPVLENSADERASVAADALSREWDLRKIEALLAGTEPSTAERDRLLAELERIPSPDLDRVDEARRNLQSVAERMDEFRGSEADRAQKLADLLRAAVEIHERHGDADCPVCGQGGGLNGYRITELRKEIERLSLKAQSYEAARRELRNARQAARDAVGVVPLTLDSPIGVDVGINLSELQTAWRAWTDLPEADSDLVAHLESSWVAVIEATEIVQSAAGSRRQQLADQWQPLADQLTEMLPIAKGGQLAAHRFSPLKSAEQWLKRCEANIRDERFASVRTEVKKVWDTLAVGSNVTLEDVRLGTKKVDMEVTVDGTESVALGVMSQGELHALALSLFVPRISISDSPFGFAMLDDPVQAMDPIRVDGLARVLNELAQTHQVVVFTHDDRLPSVVRQLRFPATVWSVTRRSDSQVELKESLSPMLAAFDDARAVALSDGLPPEARRRVVPGLCRQAIESACLESGRRQLLAKGLSHDDFDEQWAENVRLYPRLAIALYGDADRAGDVLEGLRNRYGYRAVKAAKACNKGAHHGADDQDDLMDLIRVAEELATELTRL